MKIGKIKGDTPEKQSHMISKVDETPKSYIIVEITIIHKYDTR